jgi:SH3 domain protein|tara:strand:+ start:769 stop:1485 length:717 start_codon:yes stop_codon:yes gene_type:complete
MKYLLLALSVCALSLSNNAFAEESIEERVEVEKVYPQEKTAYVTDEFLVPLRETPCSRCTIVHRGIKTGSKMRLLEVVDGWGHLITARGVEGWMEAQYLVDEPIARIKLNTQQKELAALKKRNSKLDLDFQELRAESKALRDQLDNSLGDNESVAQELADIRTISSDAIALNQQNEQLVKNNHMLQRENDALKANVDDLQKDKRNESFLYGGLTVFLGAILVILIPKLRGRKRFSEWQ